MPRFTYLLRHTTYPLRHVYLPAVPRLPTRYATDGYPLCHAFLPATPRVKELFLPAMPRSFGMETHGPYPRYR